MDSATSDPTADHSCSTTSGYTNIPETEVSTDEETEMYESEVEALVNSSVSAGDLSLVPGTAVVATGAAYVPGLVDCFVVESGVSTVYVTAGIPSGTPPVHGPTLLPVSAPC